jgi:hypothetical protein
MTDQPEMIDRVARAIFETRGYVYGDESRMFDPMKWDEFEMGEYQPTKQACREDARAAIAAMREPTREMIERATDGEMARHVSPNHAAMEGK